MIERSEWSGVGALERVALYNRGAALLVGILSDSHDRHLLVRSAMHLFDEAGVEHVIHCGDIGGIGVLDELVGRNCTFVWGNTDFRDPQISAYLETTELKPPTHIPTRIVLGDRRFAVYHGHEPGFEQALYHLDVDYICHGHTHVARDERIGRRRVINPGALHRVHIRTVATLDTETDTLKFHEL